jgi:hypothetical protein
VGQVQPRAAHHQQARQGQRAGDEARREGTALEGSRHGLVGVAEGVGGQIDSGQIAGEGYGEYPDEDRTRVQPGRHQIPGGVADGHPPEGYGADRRAEGERGQHRGHREQVLSRAGGALAAQRVRGAAKDDADRGEQQWRG